MGATRSIVQRLNPANLIGPVECLHRQEALFAEQEWFWSELRDGAFVFDNYEEAWAKAHEMPYALADEAETTLRPFAVVLGNERLAAERETRHRNRTAAQEAAIGDERVSPAEAYAATCRRLGERD